MAGKDSHLHVVPAGNLTKNLSELRRVNSRRHVAESPTLKTIFIERCATVITIIEATGRGLVFANDRNSVDKSTTFLNAKVHSIGAFSDLRRPSSRGLSTTCRSITLFGWKKGFTNKHTIWAIEWLSSRGLALKPGTHFEREYTSWLESRYAQEEGYPRPHDVSFGSLRVIQDQFRLLTSPLRFYI